ncbi:repetitive organellar protein-like isoform X1 [Eupeodes corollae]|uniref:repetitive organellar protein-like isoform X1 n=1 Tax=Eupeodes corollae TaxID=290404 RepID=UPI0024913214|nr:repetitive organellar protein-like isoform X1 [Eupeodes corollae]
MSGNQRQKICVNRSTTSSVKEHDTETASVSVQRHQQQEQQQICGDGIAAPAFEIQEKLNELYEKRLAEINEQANGDASLKEITYKEWVNMLRQINTTLITNIQEIDCETTKRLALLQRKSSSNCRHDQAIELCKCRKDIDSLMHLIRNARQNGDWSTDDIQFETVTELDIFGETLLCEANIKKESDIHKQSSSMDPKTCAAQKSKLMTHLKALAFEIAERHDEMRDLKRQIISLEDDILNAQKKIQLKDDVIRELRNDLKTFPKTAAAWGRRVSEQLSPLDCFPPMTETKILEPSEMDFPDTPRASCCKNRDSINSLIFSESSSAFQEEDQEENLIKRLKDELGQFFEIQETYDQKSVNQKLVLKDLQPRISKMVDELIKTNNNHLNKLRFFRHEYLNLENPQSSRTLTDEDSGISSDVDPDVQVLNSVRNRINCLVEENRRLKKDGQRLQIDMEGVISQEKAKSVLLEKTSRALREVADAISLALCKPIHYEEIFQQTATMSKNPIVDAFGELLDSISERDNIIEDLRSKIGNTIRLNEELQANSDNLQDQICELKNSICMNGQYENRGKLLQNQEFSRQLFSKNEELKNKVCGLEQTISYLQSKINEFQRRPCERCEQNAHFENQKLSQRQSSTHRSSSVEKLEKLENELKWKCKNVEVLKSENDQLKRELTEIRRNQAKTKLLQRRVQTPDTKPDQKELLSKLNAAEEKNLEQSKHIQKLSKQVACLQTIIEELRTNEDIHTNERKLLHFELTTLKENQASQMGTQQSIKEQLNRTNSELSYAKEKLSECNQEIQRLEKVHSEDTKLFTETYTELVKKHNNLIEDYNGLSQENQKLVQMSGEKDNILSAFDAWKRQQIEIDNEMQKKTQLFEQHIRQMLEDKQKLLERLNETESDNLILKQTLENSRHHLSGNQSIVSSGPMKGYKTSSASSNLENPISKAIENVRHTSRKLCHQRLILEDEASENENLEERPALRLRSFD